MNHHALKAFLLDLPASVNEQGEASCLSRLQAQLAMATAERASWGSDTDEEQCRQFREVVLPVVVESELGAYVNAQPRGYPGDFITQEMIWLGRTCRGSHRYAGRSETGRLINALTLDMANSEANELRARYLREVIGGSGPRIASVGCASAIEWWEPLAAEAHGVDLFIVDQDEGALASACRHMAGRPGIRITPHLANVLRFILSDNANPMGKRDLVYVFGLLDYFKPESAKRIVAALWRHVAPGGRLVVTNAHPADSTRLWMEYAGDWFLTYKDEATMSELTDDLEDMAGFDLIMDAVGVYLYLNIRRGA